MNTWLVWGEFRSWKGVRRAVVENGAWVPADKVLDVAREKMAKGVHYLSIAHTPFIAQRWSWVRRTP